MIPDEVIINGNKISKENIQKGQVMLEFPAGNVGEKDIEGKLIFTQDGKKEELPIKDQYVVVPKPNSATISADKMNVVYRGVDNPMTITFAGISQNNVSASAPGLSARSGSSYMMKPGAGKEVTINVNGKLPTGESVSDRKTFRIKDLPRPTGTVAGESGSVKMQRQRLTQSQVGAIFEDFDFDLSPTVRSFQVKVPGQPTVTVAGDRMNGAATNSINQASRGDVVNINNISATVPGVNLRTVSPVIVELTN
jgi:gliding motility-associated protein GldM